MDPKPSSSACGRFAAAWTSRRRRSCRCCCRTRRPRISRWSSATAPMLERLAGLESITALDARRDRAAVRDGADRRADAARADGRPHRCRRGDRAARQAHRQDARAISARPARSSATRTSCAMRRRRSSPRSASASPSSSARIASLEAQLDARAEAAEEADGLRRPPRCATRSRRSRRSSSASRSRSGCASPACWRAATC